MTTVFDHSHAAPRLSPNSRLVTDSASSTAPAMSKRTPCCRSVSGSSARATRKPARHSGTWAAKIHRHPNASTIGAPTTTPSTGPPAFANDQYPSALTRSSGSKTRLSIAIDAGPVAAPMPAPRTRNRMSVAAFHANAVAAGEDARARDADEVQLLVPVEVAGLAERRADDAVGEQRSGDDPRQRRLTRVEVAGDRRDRDREQRHGEPDGEQTEQRGREDEPRVAVARLDSCARACGEGGAATGRR